MTFERRIYYDHEGVYRRRREQGHTGWDAPGEEGLLDDLKAFLSSKFAPDASNALDLGCGGGEASIYLAEQDWKVTGIDYSETAVEMAEENARKVGVYAKFLVANAVEPLPFDPDSFSLILDYHVLHCFIDHADRMAYLSNAFSLLREGGIMLSVNMSSEGYFDYNSGDEIDPKTKTDRYHTRFYASLKDLLSECDEAGFRVEHFELQQDPPTQPKGATAIIYASKPTEDSTRRI